MNNKEKFKIFVSKHPELIKTISSKKRSWQDLYEVYDLYGEDEKVWNDYIYDDNKSKNLDSIGELSKMLKSVNLENVQKYINTAQKAIGIIEELTTSESTNLSGPSSKIPINKIFED